eukprot:TRINITY_DN792_c0_g1_i1.p2 TRINITY_DN792_c0_g1~~TRINITY_DN792_c0_g1_i1.p2  ORF type:complete len:220 (+),score=-7.04 TRINITY_DN792_c0_g1_i1:353-1012(+)
MASAFLVGGLLLGVEVDGGDGQSQIVFGGKGARGEEVTAGGSLHEVFQRLLLPERRQHVSVYPNRWLRPTVRHHLRSSRNVARCRNIGHDPVEPFAHAGLAGTGRVGVRHHDCEESGRGGRREERGGGGGAANEEADGGAVEGEGGLDVASVGDLFAAEVNGQVHRWSEHVEHVSDHFPHHQRVYRARSASRHCQCVCDCDCDFDFDFDFELDVIFDGP